MRNFRYRLKSSKFAGENELLILELHGFINASTFITFERVLEELVRREQTKYLLIDFNDVYYINSSGIGSLVAYGEALRKRGGAVALARVHKAVGQTMQVLGLHTMMPFVNDSAAALTLFEALVKPGAKKEPPPPKAVPEKVFLKSPPAGIAMLAAKLKDKATPQRAVLVIAPSVSRFTDTLKYWVSREGASFSVVTNTRDALASIEKTNPHLIILEDTVEGAEDFLAKVKMSRDKSLMSVIKLYPRGTEPAKRADFKIWENDFLVEPFELKELFALSEVELARVPADRATILAQSHFTFKGTEENIAKARELGRNVIFNTGLSEDAATAFFAGFQEAIDNGVRHGNRYDVRKRIDVVFTVMKDKLVVEVEDEGKGFNFNHFLYLAREQDVLTRARESRAEGKIGGLGIKLMQQCCDHIEYLGKGNRIRLEKRIS